MAEDDKTEQPFLGSSDDAEGNRCKYFQVIHTKPCCVKAIYDLMKPMRVCQQTGETSQLSPVLDVSSHTKDVPPSAPTKELGRDASVHLLAQSAAVPHNVSSTPLELETKLCFIWHRWKANEFLGQSCSKTIILPFLKTIACVTVVSKCMKSQIVV